MTPKHRLPKTVSGSFRIAELAELATAAWKTFPNSPYPMRPMVSKSCGRTHRSPPRITFQGLCQRHCQRPSGDHFCWAKRRRHCFKNLKKKREDQVKSTELPDHKQNTTLSRLLESHLCFSQQYSIRYWGMLRRCPLHSTPSAKSIKTRVPVRKTPPSQHLDLMDLAPA